MKKKIVIVVMPFLSSFTPSLQAGLVTSMAEESGWEATSFYPCLDFAALTGVSVYESLAQRTSLLLGEWLFSHAAFGEEAPDPHACFPSDHSNHFDYLFPYFDGSKSETLKFLTDLRQQKVPTFLDSIIDSFDFGSCDVVGFTCTFSQFTASVALAKRLKQRFPHLITLFGGSNFDLPMGPELYKTSDAIDIAVVGEADLIFDRLLDSLAQGCSPQGIEGVICRDAQGTMCFTEPGPLNRDLDRLPFPNYQPYFSHLSEVGLKVRMRADTKVPIESSRGCWWGQVKHCIFCGLNGVGIEYRVKSPERTNLEFRALASTYRTLRFSAVDNIMHRDLPDKLFTKFAEDNLGFRIFYETKANVKPQALATMAAGGVKEIQAGIESLSTDVLRLMRKGTTATQNVNCMRWSRYFSITLMWNFLYGFPGEVASYYEDQNTLMKKITHLEPPDGIGRLRMDRFSPLYYEAKELNVTSFEPAFAYRYIYPKLTNCHDVAYYFDYTRHDELLEEDIAPSREIIERWLKAWKSNNVPVFTARMGPDFVAIDDRRLDYPRLSYTIDGDHARVFRASFVQPRTRSALEKELHLDSDRLEAILGELDSVGLLLLDENRVLALPIPEGPFHLPAIKHDVNCCASKGNPLQLTSQ